MAGAGTSAAKGAYFPKPPLSDPSAPGPTFPEFPPFIIFAEAPPNVGVGLVEQNMKPLAALFLFIVYVAGAAASITYATSTGATLVIGLTLWTSFFGFCTAFSLMLIWSREHWMG